MADEYKPLEYFQKTDSDYSSARIRDMPAGKARFSMSVFPTSLKFVNTQAGFDSSVHTILLANNGYDTLTINNIRVVGDFKRVTTGGAPPLTTIAVGEIVPVSLVFSPKSVGSSTGGIYFDTGDAAGTEFVAFEGVGLPPGPTNPEFFMPIAGGTFTGPVSMNLGTIAESLPGHEDDPRGYLPFAPRQGGISIHGIQLRLWADMTSDPVDGDYDADMASQSNMYLVAGGGVQIIPSTNAFLPWTADGAIQSGGSPGRFRFAADMSANYIQSGGNYSGAWYKDLILCRYQSAAPWIIMDESESGNVGIGYLFPKHTEPAANGELHETWWIKWRLHVIDHAVNVMMIESTGASARLNFWDAGTTQEITIGSNGDELVFRTHDLNRLRISYNATYPGVTAYHTMGRPDFTWKAGYFLKVNMPHGGTPSGLSDGDIWTTTTGLFARINGATIGPLTGAGGVAGSVDWGNITNKPSTFPPSYHTHSQSDITGLLADLGSKASLTSPVFAGSPTVPTAPPGTNTPQIASTAFVMDAVGSIEGGGGGGGTTDWADITGKPATFPYAVPIPQADVAGLVAGLAAKADLAGATFTGKVTVPAAAAGNAGLNIGVSGGVPSSPVDGDIWVSSNVLNYRDGATTRQAVAHNTAQTITGNKTFSGTTSLALTNMTGKLTTLASTTGGSGLNIAAGAVISAPATGDFWMVGSSLFYRGASTTYSLTSNEGGQTFSGIKTFSNAGNIVSGKITFNGSAAGGATIGIAHGAAPSAPVDGDLWTTTAGLYARINGATVGPFGAGGGGGISDAPNDGKFYVRKSLAWDDFTDDLALKADVSALTSGLAGKADLASPTFTGDPKAPTPSTADNDTSIATTAFVKAQGYVTSSGVTAVSGTAPVVSSGGATPAISMAAATGAVDGYLTAANFTAFNAKVTGSGVAKLSVGTSAPSSPATGDLWVDTN